MRGSSFDGCPVTDWHWSQDENRRAHWREGDRPFPGHSPRGPGRMRAMPLNDFDPSTPELESGGAACSRVAGALFLNL